MTKEDKKRKKSRKNCGGKKSVMLAFGFTTLASRVISAASIAVIAVSFCSITKEAKAFNECIEEVRGEGESAAEAVRFCNGG